MTIWRRLKAFWLALEQVTWTCQHCHEPQDCSMLLWPDIRYKLICRYCGWMQNYPDYVRAFDPLRSEWRS